MYDDKDKKIGSATYLNKTDGQYIPISVIVQNTNCNLIQPMLNETYQRIFYIGNENRV
jgi:hypothetical protein